MTAFITDLFKQPLATLRVRDGIRLAPNADAAVDEIEIAHAYNIGGDFRNTIAVSKSLKRALTWLVAQGDGGESTPVLAGDFRRELSAAADSHFGLLQTANLIFNGVLVVGVRANRKPPRLLAEIEYSNAGKLLPDLSPPSDLAADAKLTLSRFCYLHREDDQLLLSRPLKDKRIVIRDATAGKLLIELAAGAGMRDLRDLRDAGAGDEDCDNDWFAGFVCLLNLLRHEEFVIPAADEARLPTRMEEGDDAMKQWDFHDLLSHANSRLSYNFGMNFGGAFPFVNLIEPQPAVRPLPNGERIALYKPDIKQLAANDKRLTALAVQRLSVRAYNEDAPITLRQIGEFLFRTGRVLFVTESQVASARDPERQTKTDFAWRPYPTGGASYELEFYVTVDRADGLGAGIYYYAPAAHELIKLSGRNQYTDGLIETAYISCAQIVRPQIVLHIAARFQRVSWKYHNIAYSTMLRNAGVVYQTFYLNAVAMDLAGCGLGSGNTEMFCQATGNQPHVECSIGEFMLGSLPQDFDYNAIDLEASAAIHDAKLSPNAV